jgi:PadR family transcriptional regulator PadR
MPQSTDLLQGTLDLLILQTLALEPMPGWGVAQRIQQLSKDVLQVGQGSFSPGKKQLEAELATRDRLSSAIGSVLGRVAEASQ